MNTIGFLLVVIGAVLGILVGLLISIIDRQRNSETYTLTMNKKLGAILMESAKLQHLNRAKTIRNSIVESFLLKKELKENPDHQVAIVDKKGNVTKIIVLSSKKT